MVSETLVAGVTYAGTVVRAMPTIPGLRSMAFFGTGGDGNNGNRVSGGPTLIHGVATPPILAEHTTVNQTTGLTARATATSTVSGGAVTALNVTSGGSGYTTPPSVTFTGGGGSGASATAVIAGGAVTGFTSLVPGTGYTTAPVISLSGGNLSTWRTGVTRASQLAGGWTWACVTKNLDNAAQPSAVMSDNVGNINGVITSMSIIGSDPSQSNRPILRLHQNATGSMVLQLNTTTQGAYHFVAHSYTGGAAGTFNLYDLTDGLTMAPFVAVSVTSLGAEEVCVGLWGDNLPLTGNPATTPFGIDVAWFMVADGVLSLASIQGIYASVKSSLARRGITC